MISNLINDANEVFEKLKGDIHRYTNIQNKMSKPMPTLEYNELYSEFNYLSETMHPDEKISRVIDRICRAYKISDQITIHTDDEYCSHTIRSYISYELYNELRTEFILECAINLRGKGDFMYEGRSIKDEYERIRNFLKIRRDAS